MDGYSVVTPYLSHVGDQNLFPDLRVKSENLGKPFELTFSDSNFGFSCDSDSRTITFISTSTIAEYPPTTLHMGYSSITIQWKPS